MLIKTSSLQPNAKINTQWLWASDGFFPDGGQ